MVATFRQLWSAVARVAVLATCVACGGAPSGTPLSGVLVTLDTTNARALDIYGKDRGLTPSLSRLAEESLVYDRAHTTAPITLPSHASMLTGLYPLRHGVRDNGLMPLSAEADTLAERAREAGFETAAFVSAAVLRSVYGLDQGFDVYQGPPRPEGRMVASIAERRSNEVTDAALAWLAARDASRPFFLWVHYFDPHGPYDPPSEYLARAGGRPYLGEIAAMDHDVGRLLDGLDEHVGSDNLMLAVVADHGEAHNKHGEATHSSFCYQSTMRVPLLLRFPDGRRAGERSDELVSVVDVFPTFLEELGLGTPGDVDGLVLGRDPVPDERGVYVESYSGYLNYGWSPLAGWIDGRGKYLHSSKPEFYDLASDPEELDNAFGRPGVDVSGHVAALDALAKRPRLSVGDAVALSSAEVEELRALGYAAAGEVGDDALPDPLAPSDRIAPTDGAISSARITAALSLLAQGKADEGIELLETAIAENPENLSARLTLGGALIERGRHADAVKALDELLARDPKRFLAHAYMAAAKEGLGDLEGALAHYEIALRLRPSESELPGQIERVKRRIERRDEPGAGGE